MLLYAPFMTSDAVGAEESTLGGDGGPGGLGDPGGGQAVLLEQGVGCAALGEPVAEIDVADRHGLDLGDGHGDGAAEPAVRQVLLGDDQRAGLLGRGAEGLAV